MVKSFAMQQCNVIIILVEPGIKISVLNFIPAVKPNKSLFVSIIVIRNSKYNSKCEIPD